MFIDPATGSKYLLAIMLPAYTHVHRLARACAHICVRLHRMVLCTYLWTTYANARQCEHDCDALRDVSSWWKPGRRNPKPFPSFSIWQCITKQRENHGHVRQRLRIRVGRSGRRRAGEVRSRRYGGVNARVFNEIPTSTARRTASRAARLYPLFFLASSRGPNYTSFVRRR